MSNPAENWIPELSANVIALLNQLDQCEQLILRYEARITHYEATLNEIANTGERKPYPPPGDWLARQARAALAQHETEGT